MMKKLFTALLSALAALAGTAQHTPAATAVNHPDWARNAVIYEVNVRQYTPEGTFNAFAAHLPRLKDLGVDILWFMPIHPISELNRKGQLGSYYSVADYKGVNPEFGTLDDFKALVEAAHALGMKVIIDWVPNHTGCDHPWVIQHPDFYSRNGEGVMYGPFDWSDVYQLDYGNPALRQAMTDALTFWITEAGIDGYRCDVAGRVPVDYWNTVRPALEQAAGRPVFMLAEATEPELMENAFDMDYNWPMKDLYSAIAYTAGQYTYAEDGGKHTFPEHHAADIDSLLQQQAKTYPAGSIMMNMTTNHDLNSWEGTEFKRLGDLAAAFAVLSHTLPGMPLIYTGQETGMDRALQFFTKDTPPQWTPRNQYFDFYRRLNALRHNRSELWSGAAGAPVRMLSTGNKDIIAFTRQADGKGTFVAANLGSAAAPLAIAGLPAMADATDIFSDGKGEIPSALAPGEYVVITYNTPADTDGQ